jgi:septum formation protein
VKSLILASASPRRQSLLREAGYRFDVQRPDIDEDEYFGKMLPIPLAGFLAQAKAAEIARQFPDAIALAADTVVAFGDTPIGKPRDPTEAQQTIALLSATTHIVITGLAVRCPSRELNLSRTVMSAVRMNKLTAGEIKEYVATNLWKDKAGGYGIQDPNPIVRLTWGSLSNVIGLPVDETRQLLTQAGIQPDP